MKKTYRITQTGKMIYIFEIEAENKQDAKERFQMEGKVVEENFLNNRKVKVKVLK